MTTISTSAAQFIFGCLDRVPSSRTVVAIVDAPRGMPEAFLASSWHPYGTLWVPPVGAACATSGAADRILLRGPDRFEQLRREQERVFSTMAVFAATTTPPPVPRLFGGISFNWGSSDPIWSEYGDGAFTLPRWTYTVTDEGAYLALAIGANQPRDRHAIAEELEALMVGVNKASVPLWVPTISTALVQQLGLEQWLVMLANVKGRIARGELRKVIMARRTRVPIPKKLRDVTMLMRLRREIPECTRFAFRTRHSTFLGATPELLFSKSGSHICTEALAGSIRCTGNKVAPEDERRLLASEKDRKEHAIVVDQLMDRLRPFVSKALVDPGPSTKRFRNIIHLQTPLEAELLPHVGAADLLRSLHPTAAIGGHPVAEAARCIVEVEPCERGWFAAPVGWIDRNGDALFAVGIRSGLVAHPNAYIYAGAGIVSESDAIAEYSETGLKQMPMMLAVGVDSVSLRATIAPHAAVGAAGLVL